VGSFFLLFENNTANWPLLKKFVQHPHAELLLRGFYRNLCIDGGYEICAEMYNKNILAPLSTFVPKVCVFDTRPKTMLPERPTLGRSS
jgi:hypothetical protein